MLNETYEHEPLKNKAIFECQGCQHNFKANPGPAICPKCGYIWLTWKNYRQLFK